MSENKVRRCMKLAPQFVLKHFCWFDGQNYLFKLLRTLELLIIKSQLLIIYEFPQNTPASHTPANDISNCNLVKI